MATVVLGNRVLVQTTTVATATYQLGAALTGFVTCGGGGITSGKRVPYGVVDSLTAPTLWEVGEGIFTSGAPDTLTRALIIGSSSGGSAVSWGVGTKYIFIAPHAGQTMLREAEGNAVLTGIYQMLQVYAYSANLGTLFGNAATMGRFRCDTSVTDEVVIEKLRNTAGSDNTGTSCGVSRLNNGVNVGRYAFDQDGGMTLAPAATSNTITLNGRGYATQTVRFGQNSTDQPGVTNTTAGASVQNNGAGFFSAAVAAALYVNINTDGQAAVWQRSGVIVGSVNVTTTATTYATSSDRRLKRDIAPLTGAWDRVKALQPRFYHWNVDPQGPLVRGFIADELSSVVPDAVLGVANAVTESGGIIPQQVDYSRVVPDMAAALQEALARIEALEALI